MNEIFAAAWQGVEQKFGKEHLSFPKEIFWLNGAPGAGKGTNTDFIMQFRGYKNAPIVTSDLLQTPEARRLMDAGLLVGDREVIELLLGKLLDKEFATGAIVDGFPRTKIQVDFLKFFAGKIDALHREFNGTANAEKFPPANFHVIVLFVDEAESVARQLKRGRESVAQNQQVRKTDTDAEAARKRYQVFEAETLSPLQELREFFHYHHIDANGALPDVQARIAAELS